MKGELRPLLTLAFLGFLVVLYGAIEAYIWLYRRFSDPRPSAPRL